MFLVGSQRLRWRNAAKMQKGGHCRPPPKICPGVENSDVLSLPALGSLDDVELNGLAFLQRAEALRLDRRVVNKHILAALPRDEAVALSVIEPLYCSLFHGGALNPLL